MKAQTNILCNGCYNLSILKRKIRDNGTTGRNVWILGCKENNLYIATLEIQNRDLKNKEIPEIKAPWDCVKRQELRKQNKESHFILSIY